MQLNGYAQIKPDDPKLGERIEPNIRRHGYKAIEGDDDDEKENMRSSGVIYWVLLGCMRGVRGLLEA